jgi:hypothetical protein
MRATFVFLVLMFLVACLGAPEKRRKRQIAVAVPLPGLPPPFLVPPHSHHHHPIPPPYPPHHAIPHDPPPGQRCRGRNFNGRRCCTPLHPCNEGEGDCDGPGDGGGNDGHDGCKGNLVCGSNNCKKFGHYYHEKDDCCERPSWWPQPQPSLPVIPHEPHHHHIPSHPPQGQRCSGRNFNGRRCCTPENPCGVGEGDCDGPGDGGGHDGHRGCRGNLVCGSNNCKKFGHYYHDKDDCCEHPGGGHHHHDHHGGGWGLWSGWGPCRWTGGYCKTTRTRYCRGHNCRNSRESQNRICGNHQCRGNHHHWNK